MLLVCNFVLGTGCGGGAYDGDGDLVIEFDGVHCGCLVGEMSMVCEEVIVVVVEVEGYI